MRDPKHKKCSLTTLIPCQKSILFVTGLRRVGKTSLIRLAIRRLLSSGINPKNIFYIGIDDYTLKDLSILEIIREYKKINNLTNGEKSFIFLDEITYKEDFRQQLKTLHDNSNNKITVSSSSSSSLRNKKGWLTGRERILEVHPLTFTEFLEFKQIKIKKSDTHLSERYFEEYMQIGGIPAYVLNNDRAYLTSMVDDIIQKDIIAHHGIKHTQIVKDYFMLIMERAGKQISINKVANILKISPDTANRYMQMFLDTYLISLIPRYGTTNEQILSPKKVYASDLGIKNIFTGFRDEGSIFENYVFMLIKDLKPRYIYENEIEIEIDFITIGKTLIEVKYNQNIEEKQKRLFEAYSAKNKLFIGGIKDLKLLANIK